MKICSILYASQPLLNRVWISWSVVCWLHCYLLATSTLLFSFLGWSICGVDWIVRIFPITWSQHYWQVAIFVAVAIGLLGAWLGFWGVRKLVLSEDGRVDAGTVTFVKWAIRIVGCVMLLQVLYISLPFLLFWGNVLSLQFVDSFGRSCIFNVFFSLFNPLPSLVMWNSVCMLVFLSNWGLHCLSMVIENWQKSAGSDLFLPAC